MAQHPALVGQRIHAVRRLSVREQSELGIEHPNRTGPIVIELGSGVQLFALDDLDQPSRLVGALAGEVFDVAPSGMEVEG